jgi:hypothetical protein
MVTPDDVATLHARLTLAVELRDAEAALELMCWS